MPQRGFAGISSKDYAYSGTSGYLLLSAIIIMLFALVYQDTGYLTFGIPIIMVFILAASVGKGNTDSDLAQLGWTSQKLDVAIPLGILGGVVSLFLGSIIIGKLSTGSLATIVPDFSGMGKLGTASVVPAMLATSANLISQWLIVAPSEESLTKILGPIAIFAITKNVVIAYLGAMFLWGLMHYPKFLMTGQPNSMYIVLAVVFGIALLVFYLSGNIMGAIVSHATFNSSVILIGENVNTITIYVVGVIAAILIYAFYTSRSSKA